MSQPSKLLGFRMRGLPSSPNSSAAVDLFDFARLESVGGQFSADEASQTAVGVNEGRGVDRSKSG